MHNPDLDFDAFDAALKDAPGFFVSGSPIHIARAPGRLDVMGGIADYSGALVAEMPIAQAAVVGAQAGGTEDGAVIVRSANAEIEGFTQEVSLPRELFINPVSLLRYVRDAAPSDRWVGYAAGCMAMLRAEGLVPRGAGARIFLRSDVPLGAGVSSSAAVEVATMRALTSAFHIDMDGLTLARLCQRAENDVMDAPCGVMDQVTGALGEAGKLLLLLCQPYTLQGTLALPDDWSVFGIDSRVKHSIAGADYTGVRVAAFMGFKILAEKAGNGFGGYLCNVSPESYAEFMPDGLPETMNGAAFLGAHGGIFDTVTTVQPGVTYPVRAAAEHAIFEMQRVQNFVAALRDGSDAAIAEAGRQMYGSHESYSRCGLGTEATDLLVELGKTEAAVAGAKITGGGSGGTVCFLVRKDQEADVIERIVAGYEEQAGRAPRIICGSSSGSFATPIRQKVL